MTNCALTCIKRNAMKRFLVFVFIYQILALASTRAASDADVTIIKAAKVTIAETVITIVAEATTRITLIQDNRDPAYKGLRWMGRPATWVHVKSDKATFTIRQSHAGVLD